MSRNGKISEKSTQTSCQELMLFPVDSLAQTYQSPTTIQKELQGRGRDYGETSSESYAHYDHATQSWRTYQHFLGEGLEKLSETWHPSGLMRNGKLFRLHGSEPSIAVRESGYWPTPRASDGKRLRFTVKSLRKVVSRNQNSGNNFSLSLPELIKLMSDGKSIKISFVEMMMGMPTHWTDCRSSVTAKYRKHYFGSEKE